MFASWPACFRHYTPERCPVHPCPSPGSRTRAPCPPSPPPAPQKRTSSEVASTVCVDPARRPEVRLQASVVSRCCVCSPVSWAACPTLDLSTLPSVPAPRLGPPRLTLLSCLSMGLACRVSLAVGLLSECSYLSIPHPHLEPLLYPAGDPGPGWEGLLCTWPRRPA